MPFVQRQWVDRIPAAGKAGRRSLKDVNTSVETLYDVSMADDATTAGDEWNAENMNDLETRISNVLTSDYKIQTGTFTPTINTNNVGTRTGTYYRIGNLCFITIHIKGTSASGTSNALKITGLPFTPFGTEEQTLIVGYHQGVSPSGTKMAIIPSGSSDMNLWVNEIYLNDGSILQRIEQMKHTSTGVLELRICGVYRIS